VRPQQSAKAQTWVWGFAPKTIMLKSVYFTALWDDKDSPFSSHEITLCTVLTLAMWQSGKTFPWTYHCPKWDKVCITKKDSESYPR